METSALSYVTRFVSRLAGASLLGAAFFAVAADSPALLDQYCLSIENAVGGSVAEAQKNLGAPSNTIEDAFIAEDSGVRVIKTELIYPDGKVIFQRIQDEESLFSADFEGGGPGFGEIAFGDDADKVEGILGEPHAVRNWVWTYHAGMRRIHIGFDLDGHVNRLIYERDAF